MANELKRSKRILFDESSENDINPENLSLLRKYKMDMELRELSPKSIYNYERDIIQWMSYLCKNQFNLNIKQVTEDDIEEFLYFCKQQGNNTERIKRRASSVSALYKFLRKKKEILDNPCEFISRPKKSFPVVVQTFLTQEQYDMLKYKLTELGNLQLQTYIMFGIDTMARVNACSNIKWEQIDFENRTIDNVLEKEGYLVTLYFGEEVKELLLKLQNQRKQDGIDDQGYVFITKNNGEYDRATVTTMSNWTKKAGELINVPTLHCHDLRHSGSQLRKLKGMDLETISRLLNHAGLDVTKKHYLRDDKGQMRERMDKFKI
jgi:integrase